MNMLLNKPEVAEVLDWLKSGQLMREEYACIEGVAIVHRMVMVRDWDCVIPRQYDFTEDLSIWKDILETEIAEFFCKPFDDESIHMAISELSESLLPLVRAQMPLVYLEPDFGFDYEIVYIMRAICHSRYLYGIRPGTFFENVFEAYKSGGLPCGWDGPYPDGRMIVYYAPEDGHKPILWRDEGSDETDERYHISRD